MTEWVKFDRFITKGITVEKGDRRIFKGHITAEIVDRQQEFIFVAEVMKIMKAFMEVNPVISDFHSNRMVGTVLKYEQSEYQGVATVLITGEIYKKDGITLYDKVWDKVVKGIYAGLSMGGASKQREPIMKDGRMVLELKQLELYEIALCETPANPFAIIESVNIFAKSVGLDQEMIKEENGREFIQCTSLGCMFEKGTNLDADVDIDNKRLEQFDKDPVEKFVTGNSIERKELQEEEHKKGVGDATSLVGRSAETRSESVGESTGSPKEVNDIINTISSGTKGHKKDSESSHTFADLTPEEQKKQLEGRIKDNAVEKDYASQDSQNRLTPEDQQKKMEGKIKDGDITKHHQLGLTDEQEYGAKAKKEGEKAGSRTISVDKELHDESNNPAEHAQSIDDRMHTRAIQPNNLKKIQIEQGKLGEVVDKEVEKEGSVVGKLPHLAGTRKQTLIEGNMVETTSNRRVKDLSKDGGGVAVPEDTPKHWKDKNVNAYLKHFGVDNVRKAIEDYDTLEYIKKLARKYN